MSKTAVMFAGIDALDTEALRFSTLQIPEVQRRVQQAHKFLWEETAGQVSLKDYMVSSEADFQAQLPLKAFICAAAQIGLFDRYLKTNSAPDYLVGCSLGDAARTVCSGAMSFEEMLYGTYLFGREGDKVTDGSVVCCKSLLSPLSAEEIQEIEACGLDIAVYQTPVHFLVVGKNDVLHAWAADLKNQQRYLIRPLCNRPLHSHAMTGAMTSTLTHFGSFKINHWNIPMVSSTHRKVIETPEDLRVDMNSNMTGAVHWSSTYMWMVDELQVNRFVNIGPARTMIKFCERTPTAKSVELMDCMDLVTAEQLIPALA
ncbi:ACP S-malonyltransferase [Bdellovibrio svalbardensis]|uniref:[acyl-carrier-protein] S-malonyltransferase n=1 Tax=Bdellovibrio svalbardensis TaxID=2972972 RepID=A0ABT6DHK7_9BACT|nr:hypothetical protein [Bdellovibrio svalbardensis]MDG0815957.1 hypothetical protein [Bdellovibrio svalbardensis]